jgi:hypothetical protein
MERGECMATHVLEVKAVERHDLAESDSAHSRMARLLLEEGLLAKGRAI